MEDPGRFHNESTDHRCKRDQDKTNNRKYVYNLHYYPLHYNSLRQRHLADNPECSNLVYTCLQETGADDVRLKRYSYIRNNSAIYTTLIYCAQQ